MSKTLLSVLATIVFAALVVVLAVRELKGRETVSPTSDAESGPGLTTLFDLASSIDVAMSEPRGITLSSDGNIVVSGSGTVEIYSLGGALTDEYIIESRAECVAYNDDKFYLGTGDHVTVLDINSESVTEWTVLDERSIITSIAVSGKHVFVADAGTRRVWVFDLLGMLTNTIEGFIVPSPYFDVAPEPTGKAWIVDPGRHTIALVDAEGVRYSSFGRYSIAIDGFSGCCNPTNISARTDGTVITAEKGIMRVKLFGGDGAFLGIVATAEAFPVHDADIDVAAAGGKVLILSPKARTIFVFKEKSEKG